MTINRTADRASLWTTEMIALRAHIGKLVTIERTWKGQAITETGKLLHVNPLYSISIDDGKRYGMHNGRVIGYDNFIHRSGDGIQKISAGGKTLYENKLIKFPIGPISPDQMEEITYKCFGIPESTISSINSDFVRREQPHFDFKYDLALKNEKHRINTVIKEGRKVVKADLADEWEYEVRSYASMLYNMPVEVYASAVDIMKTLNSGKSAEEAMATIHISELDSFREVFLKREIIKTVLRFHEQGLKIAQLWHKTNPTIQLRREIAAEDRKLGLRT